MNQEQNNSTETNTNQTVQVNLNKVDPKTVQPTVLGELRTEKIGNPSLLFAFLAIIAVVMILLPLGSSMLQDGNSFLYRLVYGKQDVVIEDDPVDANEPLDGSIINKLELTTTLKAGNLMVSTFVLSQGQVECQIYSYSGTLNLEEEQTFLQIYSSTNEESLIGYVKLNGDSYDHQPKSVTLYNNSLNFNKTHEYYGKIVTFQSDADYPSYDAPADEFGIGTMTCTRDSRTIEYDFQNNYLISMKDTESRKKKSYSSDQAYIKALTDYSDKALLLGEFASVTEEEEGFTYVANINLEGFTYSTDFKDNNYYKVNDVAKVIRYNQIGKGYDCK